MREGWLWFDNSNAELKDKVVKAARYYHSRFKDEFGNGIWPTLCFVHTTMLLDYEVNNGFIVPIDSEFKEVIWSNILDGMPFESSGVIEVRTTNSVLPNHFWLGNSID